MSTQLFLNLISSHSGIASEFDVWHLHIWKLHLYTRGDLPWLSRCGAWSASPCLWYLWLEGGDRPWHLGEVAAFTSAALFLEAVGLAVPSTTDWSSLSLLLARGEKTDGKMGQWWIPKICTLMSEWCKYENRNSPADKMTCVIWTRKASRVPAILSTALHTCFPILFGRHT